MRALGQAARGPGAAYLSGGACAVLLGWRETTLDVDLTFDPEPPGVFDAIARLKDELEINVEIAAPDQFIPPVPGWRERSQLIEVAGPVRFLHYDFHAQALAKIERGHAQDLGDVREMLRRKLVEPAALRRMFEQIRPELRRYPAIDPDVFREKLDAILAEEER
jgi:hypothetical protein